MTSIDADSRTDARPAVVGPQRLPVADRAAILMQLRAMSVGRRWQIAGVVLLFLISAAAGLVLPLTIGWIVDTVVAADGSGVPAVFWWQLGGLAIAAILGGVVEFGGMVALTRLAETMLAELRENYVDTALGLPPATVEAVGVGDIVSRASTDIRRVSDDLPNVIPAIAAALFTLALATAGTVLIDWRFTLVFLLAIPLYVLALRWYLPAVPPVYAAEAAAESARSEAVLSTINALPSVIALRGEPDRIDRVRTTTWELSRWAMRTRIMQNRFFGRINLAEAVGMLLVLSCGFLLAAYGGASLGQITAAGLLFLQITGPIAVVMFVMDDAQAAAASLARIIGVAAPSPEPNDGIAVAGTPSPAVQNPVSVTYGGTPADEHRAADPAVQVEAVSFGYRPHHAVIDGVSLTIDAGEHVAIVGATGSGKTTLAQLVSRARRPEVGTIGGSVAPEGIAYLNQDSHIFAATLRENLALAAPNADDDSLRGALDRVGAGRLLEALPDGLDTMVGRAGHRLTGAEAQLISLARMVLADPAVAILDEATSESDSEHTALLDRATEQALAGRAAIVIAHRLSQARMCDRIVVMDRGRVIEEGTHTEMVGQSGRYAELWAAYSGSSA